MAANPQHQLSVFEKLDLIPAQLACIGAALYAAITSPFWAKDVGADTYLHNVTHAMVRKMVTRMNFRQLQYLTPPFETTYSKFCASNKLKADIVTLPSGIKAFFIGERTAANIALYFHGGGFSLDGDETHLGFWNIVRNDLESSNKSVAFLFVAYTLVPYGTYPVQIREAVEALSYCLNTLGRFPSDIVLAGDSAGGNMCLSILSHLSHPHPDIPEIKMEGKLKAIVAVAPWVSFKTDWPSMKRNAYKDLITPQSGALWSADYLAGKPTDPYAEPYETDASWWEDPKVEQILCVAGADEILVDSINRWVEKYKSVNPDSITYVCAKNEVHDAPILEPRFGDPKETEQGRAIKSFLKSRL